LLAGVEIPADKGELGHSDGDVLAHAVADALLGAAALGDIGEMFPPSDPRWKDAPSMELLGLAWNRVRASGWRLANLDCVISLESPRILPHRGAIQAALAALLGVPPEVVLVKGKTGEGLGPVGEGLAVEAMVVCLLEK
jgi:2-C-methyl-D-erythritol 2,4-cyclodiphosphate synthase